MLATYVLIFNQFTLEFLLFPESAVMCLSVLFVILASVQTLETKKGKYFKIFIYLLISIISYQSTIMAFIVISLLLNCIGKNETRKSIKEILKELAKYVVIMIGVIAIEYIIILIMNNILGEKLIRIVKIINFDAFVIRLKYAISNTLLVLLTASNTLPFATLVLVIVATIGIMLLNSNLRKQVKYYVFIIMIIILEVFAMMFLFDSGNCLRTNWIIGTIWGISLVVLLQQENKFEKFVKIFIVISFVFNSYMLLQNSFQHIAANKLESSMGNNIKYKLEKYEEETGNTITKFAYTTDYNPSQHAKEIKKLGSLTERALACDWSVCEAINYYTNRKLKHIKFDILIYLKKMEHKDYDDYTDEQLLFEGDTLYMVIY